MLGRGVDSEGMRIFSMVENSGLTALSDARLQAPKLPWFDVDGSVPDSSHLGG